MGSCTRMRVGRATRARMPARAYACPRTCGQDYSVMRMCLRVCARARCVYMPTPGHGHGQLRQAFVLVWRRRRGRAHGSVSIRHQAATHSQTGSVRWREQAGASNNIRPRVIPVWLESKQAPLKLSCAGELVSWVSLLESASLARCSRLCVTIAV